jgi:hypothetical protein
MPAARFSKHMSRIGIVCTALILACTGDHRLTAPHGGTANPLMIIDGGHFLVCKYAGPPGTYHFSMTVSGGGNWTHTANLDDFTIDFDGVEPACRDDLFAATDPETWPDGALASIDVTEILPPGIKVDSIRIFSPVWGVWDPKVTGTATISKQVGFDDWYQAEFYNGIDDTPPPVVANCAAVTAVEGVAITPVAMTASGGTGGPYTFVANGLPDGLTMSTDGTISGTATVSGTFYYSVTVTDKDGHTGTVNCSLLVSPPPPPLICTDITAANYGGALPCVYLPPCPAGSFTYTYSSSGDLQIKYDQFPAPNDNSYGVNSVGWGTKGHKFSDLTGSDHAGFQLVDPGGVVRLSFNVDYISASASAPSGYASLGVTGGDGGMLVGTATGITATSSLAMNLNNINIPGLFNAAHVQQFGSVNLLIDSPPTDPLQQTYVISDPTLVGWDFHDTYFVTISAAKLASIGFDPDTWTVSPNASQLHNSPAKACPTNTGAAAVTQGKTEVHDKEVRVDLTNTGSSDVYLSDLTITWPAATNGKLMKVKLEGDVVYDKPDIAGGAAHITLAQLVKDQNKRKIPRNKTETVIFVFEKNADSNLTHYSATVQFGSLNLTILPPP